MGRRGPPPTPARILKLRGTFRKDRVHNPAEGPGGRPICPTWLDDEAKAAWKQIVPLLDAMKVLTRIDRHALIRYCQSWSRWKKAEQFIQSHGEAYPLKDDSTGKIKCLMPFPQVSIANKLSAVLRGLEQEFGMTPSARSRINVPIAPRAISPDGSRYFGDSYFSNPSA